MQGRVLSTTTALRLGYFWDWGLDIGYWGLGIGYYSPRSAAEGDWVFAACGLLRYNVTIIVEGMNMSQTTVSVRELKARLSYYMQQVKAGAILVVTERGKAIGRIAPQRPSVETRMQELVQAGLVAWNGRKLAPLAPVARTRGNRMVADLLLEDREYTVRQILQGS